MSGKQIVLMMAIPPAEYVYALRRCSDGRIKIGHTTDFWKRLRKLANSYGEFDVLGIRYGTEADENVVRNELRPYRVKPKHDWFYASVELFRYIQDNFAAHAAIHGIRHYDGNNYHVSHRRCNCGYDFCLLDHDRCHECLGDTLRKRGLKQQWQPIQYLSASDYWQAQHTASPANEAAVSTGEAA